MTDLSYFSAACLQQQQQQEGGQASERRRAGGSREGGQGGYSAGIDRKMLNRSRTATHNGEDSSRILGQRVDCGEERLLGSMYPALSLRVCLSRCFVHDMCVCVCVCAYVCAWVGVDTCLYVYVCACMYVFEYVYIYTHICVNMYISV